MLWESGVGYIVKSEGFEIKDEFARFYRYKTEKAAVTMNRNILSIDLESVYRIFLGGRDMTKYECGIDRTDLPAFFGIDNNDVIWTRQIGWRRWSATGDEDNYDRRDEQSGPATEHSGVIH